MTGNNDGHYQKQTVLIVDDEPTNLQLLSNQLREEYLVLVAKSGQQALHRLETNNIDLVLLDIVMPDMDGYEVIYAIKENPKFKNIPVIFISSRTESEEEIKGLRLGAVDYIGKPFQPAIVQARVRTHMALKRRTELLDKISHVDGLTELDNRRRFDERLEYEWNRARRNGNPLSVIMIDVDFFKRFNDNLGHIAGDNCLRKVARVLESLVQRSTDEVARYGGEEFAIIAPEVDLEGISVLAERCVAEVNGLHYPHPDSDVSAYVSISVGAATVINISPEANPRELVAAADQQLYQAKQRGRNQACTILLTS